MYIKGRNWNKYRDFNEWDNDMVWQINSYRLRGNLNIWEGKVCSFSLAALLKHSRFCSQIYRQYCWIKYKSRCIYKYAPCCHVQLLCQCIKQSVKKFSNTQRHVTIAGCYELRWFSFSNKLSPISTLQMSDVLSEAKYSLCLVAAFCVHSVECVEGVWGLVEFDIYWAGEG